MRATKRHPTILTMSRGPHVTTVDAIKAMIIKLFETRSVIESYELWREVQSRVACYPIQRGITRSIAANPMMSALDHFIPRTGSFLNPPVYDKAEQAIRELVDSRIIREIKITAA